jgi:medium-chain acyl-[acyl-carrier-protein] hydrolase
MSQAVPARSIQSARQPVGSLRLFCLPYAGGSAAIYSSWCRLLPEFEVVAIELPGHANRMGEPPFRRIEPLVEDLLSRFRPMFEEKTFAFFGHSMGALISFELARKLAVERDLRPEAIFVSGNRAPHLPRSERSRLPSHDLPRDEFLEELRRLNGTPSEVLQCSELMELMLPIVRADFELVNTYEYRGSLPLSCPITVFGGSNDIETRPEELDAWRPHTTDRFSLHMLPGDHFFLHSQQDSLLQILRSELRRLSDARVEEVH